MKEPLTRQGAARKGSSSSPSSGPAESDPVGVPHRQLGQMLREFRTERGISILDAARFVGMGSSTLQRLERGEGARTIDERRLSKLCQLYDRSDRLEELKTLAAQRREQSWWDERTDEFAPSFKVYLGLESGAERLTVYRPDIISSLFQTQDYAEVLDRTYFPDDEAADRERRMQLLRRRQHLITRSLAPIEVDLVIDEGVLRRMVGGPRVMSRQLKHLADMPENVQVRILPDSAGYPMGKAVGAFTLVDARSGTGRRSSLPPVVYVESFAGSMHLEKQASVRAYREAHRVIQRVALDSVETKRLLRRAAKEYAP